MSDDGVTMTMSYVDEHGQTATTAPFTTADLKRATKAVKSLTPDQVRAACRFPKEPTPMFDAKETGEESAMTVAAGQLRAFIERVERLEEEKQTIADDIKEIFGEAKGTGFDTKAMRTIIRLRKKDKAERDEEEAIVDLYMSALGMV